MSALEIRVETVCTATVVETWAIVVPEGFDITDQTAIWELLRTGEQVLSVHNDVDNETDRTFQHAYIVGTAQPAAARLLDHSQQKEPS